jgi:photosystem II stability/assembly factor-like uncharacterized protein
VLLGVLLAFGSATAAGVWEGPGGGMVFAIAVSRTRPRTIYAGTARGGIFVSADGGRTWRRLTRTRRPQRVRGLAVDGAGMLYAADIDGGILVSGDGGESWTVHATGTGPVEISNLAIDRRTRPAVVYAGTSAGEVIRSPDRGETWSRSGAGLEGRPVLALAIDPRRRAGVLWAGTAGGIFHSTDAGATWRKVDSLVARRLLVDPTRRHTLLAVNEGVFRSTDAGRSWQRLPTVRYAQSLAIDARTTPGTLYAGTSYSSVLKSTDGGDTWSSAGGALSRLAEVVELAVDGWTTPGTVYAGLSGMGVYRSSDGGESWLADEGRETAAR